MEARILKRRGSALAVLLIVVSALIGMLTLEYACWRGVQRGAGDSILQPKLDTAARDALERATMWIFQRKPGNPRGGYGVMRPRSARNNWRSPCRRKSDGPPRLTRRWKVAFNGAFLPLRPL